MNSLRTQILAFALLVLSGHPSSAETRDAAPKAEPDRIWSKANFPDTECCEAIVFDPQNPKRIVLGTRPGGLWESMDSGISWSQLKTIMPSALRYGFNPGSIVAHPRVKDLWFAGVELNGAYRSLDSGKTWKQINKGLGKGYEMKGICFAFDATDDRTVFYGSDGGLYKSTDSGDSWSKCTRGLPRGDKEHPGTTVSRLGVDPLSGTVYAAFYAVGSKEVPGIYKSGDRGETWQAVNNCIETGPDEEMLRAMKAASKKLQSLTTDDSLNAQASTNDKGWSFDLQISPVNSRALFAATYRTLYRTDDACENWYKCEEVSIPRSVAFHPKDPLTVVVSGWQTIWISRDGGLTWRDTTAGLNDPEKPAKPPKIIDIGNGLKGMFSEKTDIFTPELITFEPNGERLFALTTQGLWIADCKQLK